MATRISGNFLSEANTVAPPPPGQGNPVASAQSTAATTRPLEDTVQLSPAAKSAQASSTPQIAQIPPVLEVQILAEQGQNESQIAAKLSLPIPTVREYLGEPQQ